MRRPLPLALLLIGASCAGRTRELPPALFENGARYHLRSAGEAEWDEFAGPAPHGPRLEERFPAKANAGEATLFLWQQDVKWEWNLKLNGKTLRRLERQPESLVLAVPLPPGSLQDGENVLSIEPPRAPEDIRVGRVRIDPRPRAESLGDAYLDIQVLDPLRPGPLPCRVTIVDGEGSLAPFLPLQDQLLAVRPGILYTGDGRARITLPEGKYTLYATRGFEYGLDSVKVALEAGDKRAVVLRIRREVPTPNLVACDTHVHTLELSGHGDASLDERMLTLAGEGLELPVATEHNQHADYAPAAARTAMARHFTPVRGNEVTTPKGHFNVFPVRPGAPVPNARRDDWTAVLKDVRATPDVKVVILNHPRGLHEKFIPFAPENFHAASGENRRGFEFTFDAIELVNSGAQRTDFMQVYRDWFALLNSGVHATGVGSSDSHDVNQYLVGQGRTYIVARDADPAAIDIDEAAGNLLRGRAYVCMGLLTTIQVNGRYGVGDLARGIGESLEVAIRVFGPSWAQADRVELYQNGVKVREVTIPVSSGGGEKVQLSWKIPRPPNDAHLVAIATGPGISAPWWPIPRPYQPSSPRFVRRLIGSTNPVWIDADGDGVYTSPRALAKKLDLQSGVEVLSPYDEAVAIQAASLLHASGRDLRGLLEKAAPAVRRGFEAYLAEGR